MNWVKTPCRIEESRVRPLRTGYEYVVAYAYRYNAVDYQSYKYHFKSQVFNQWAEAGALAEKYKPGQDAVCYVDAANPERAVLDNGWSPWPFLFFFLPLGCAIFGLHTIQSAWFGGLASPSPIKRYHSPMYSWGLACLSLFAIASGLALGQYINFKPMAGYATCWFWQETACTIERSLVQTEFDGGKKRYWVDVLYVYSFNDEEHRSNAYNFGSEPTKGYSAKKEIIEAYPKGSGAKCFVNPLKPSQSVLKRELGFSPILLLAPLLPLGAGVYGLWLASGGKRRRRRLNRNVWKDGGSFSSESGKQVFKPKLKRRIVTAAVFLFLLCWIGYFLFCFYDVLAGGDDWDDFSLYVIMIFLGLLYIAPHAREVLSWFSPWVEVTLHSGRLSLGDDVKLTWQIHGDRNKIESFAIVLAGLESVRQQGKKNSEEKSHLFFQKELVSRLGPALSSKGEILLNLPRETMHSLEAEVESFFVLNTKYSITWLLVVLCKGKGRPNPIREYPLKIHPIKGL